MAYNRQRRSAQKAPHPVDEDGDRLYTEEDYAAPEEPIDEWDAPPAYLPHVDLPPEAFLPEESEQPQDEAFAPDAEEWSDAEWAGDPFSVPGGGFSYASDEFDDDLLDDDDPLAEELLTDEEREELRRSNWKLMAGLADFAGVIVGTAAILVIVALLVSLLNWLMADISQSFVLLQKNF